MTVWGTSSGSAPPSLRSPEFYLCLEFWLSLLLITLSLKARLKLSSSLKRVLRPSTLNLESLVFLGDVGLLFGFATRNKFYLEIVPCLDFLKESAIYYLLNIKLYSKSSIKPLRIFQYVMLLSLNVLLLQVLLMLIISPLWHYWLLILSRLMLLSAGRLWILRLSL